MNSTAGSPIALVGLMGAGKSEVARLLAARLDLPLRDLDAEFERESGLTVARWFAERGEGSFRERERELLELALAAGPSVIACGGGAVLDPASREALVSRCRTVWLEVSPGEAAQRLAGQEQTRPLMAVGNPAEQLSDLLRLREPVYARVALHRVRTDGRSAEEVANAVVAALASGPTP